jgi:hypothetical protein
VTSDAHGQLESLGSKQSRSALQNPLEEVTFVSLVSSLPEAELSLVQHPLAGFKILGVESCAHSSSQNMPIHWYLIWT